MHIITTDSKAYTIKNLPWNTRCKALISFSRLFLESLNINLSSYYYKVLILYIFLAAYILYISLYLAEHRTTFFSSKCLHASSSTFITRSDNMKRRDALSMTRARIQAVNWCACIILCALPQSEFLPMNTITETTHILPSFKYGQRNQKGTTKKIQFSNNEGDWLMPS